MGTPDPLNDTPGALKQVVLTPHDIPWSLTVKQSSLRKLHSMVNFDFEGGNPYTSPWMVDFLWYMCHAPPQTHGKVKVIYHNKNLNPPKIAGFLGAHGSVNLLGLPAGFLSSSTSEFKAWAAILHAAIAARNNPRWRRFSNGPPCFEGSVSVGGNGQLPPFFQGVWVFMFRLEAGRCDFFLMIFKVQRISK